MNKLKDNGYGRGGGGTEKGQDEEEENCSKEIIKSEERDGG